MRFYKCVFSHNFQGSFFLGFDINESQLKKAYNNVQFANLTEKIDLIRASVMGKIQIEL